MTIGKTRAIYLSLFLRVKLTKCLIFRGTFSQRICIGSIWGTNLLIILIAEIITAKMNFKLERLSLLTLNKDFHPLVCSTNKMMRNKYIRIFLFSHDWLRKQFDLTQDINNCRLQSEVESFEFGNYYLFLLNRVMSVCDLILSWKVVLDILQYDRTSMFSCLGPFREHPTWGRSLDLWMAQLLF